MREMAVVASPCVLESNWRSTSYLPQGLIYPSASDMSSTHPSNYEARWRPLPYYRYHSDWEVARLAPRDD